VCSSDLFRAEPRQNPLATPSGKIEISSKVIAGFGYDDAPGHPTWLPPEEWLGAAGKDALALLTRQPARYLHSQLAQVTTDEAPRISRILLHPDDAGKRGIADGDVATGVKGFDPLTNNQLVQEEIDAAQANSTHQLKLKFYAAAQGEEKRRGPRYTPLSKRQDRPASILWLVKFHPELTDGQISKLVGTTKPTIQAIRERTHWNISNIQPIDPVALGLCKQTELDTIVQKAAAKKRY